MVRDDKTKQQVSRLLEIFSAVALQTKYSPIYVTFVYYLSQMNNIDNNINSNTFHTNRYHNHLFCLPNSVVDVNRLLSRK